MSIFIDGKKTADRMELQWSEHPEFKGVFMKNILLGDQTARCLSYHLVKIEPNCTIGEHIHENKPELHEIIEGSGSANIQGHEIKYEKNTTSLIDRNIIHSIKAGDRGLLLRATFVPALN
jgi:quercetin dioxygenase-like cupin family protein